MDRLVLQSNARKCNLQICQATRIRIMVTLGHVFTRGQVADLISRALSVAQVDAWGAGFLAGQNEAGERHMDVLAAAYRVGPFREIDARMEAFRRTTRREADIAGAYPWRTDHPGGPVPAW